MLIFFDYTYYIVCKWYLDRKSSSPEFGAVCVISGLQAFNVISIFLLIEVLSRNKNIFSKLFFIAPILILLIANYIQYIYKETKSYAFLKEKFTKENIKNKKIVWPVYFFVSLTLCFGLAIYLGSKKW